MGILRTRAAVLLTALAVALPLIAPAHAQEVQVLGPVRSDDDFATRRIGDPWDMSAPSDIAFELTRDVGNIAGLRFENGLLIGTSTTNDPRIYLLLPTNPAQNPSGREGGLLPINADFYRYLTVRLYVPGGISARDTIQVYWQKNGNELAYGSVNPQAPGSPGRLFRDGWSTLTIDLKAVASGVPWQGQIQGLYVDPTTRPGVTFYIDYVRLSSRPPSTQIVLNGQGDLYIKRAGTADEPERVVRGFNGSYVWPQQLAAGTYEIAAGNARDILVVNTTPQLRIVAPGYFSGPEFAAEVRGNPWDMNDSGDADAVVGTSSYGFQNGFLSATSSDFGTTTPCGPGIFCGDPQVALHLRPNQPIDSNRYRYLAVRMRVDGPINTALGSVGRLIWTSTSFSQASVSQSWIVAEGWQTYVFDLAKLKLEAGGIPWSQSRPIALRIDPHEFAAPRRFEIDYARLSGDERANQFFDIRYTLSDPDGPASTVRFFYTPRQDTITDGTPINCGPTGGVCRWDTSQVPNGIYYIYGNADDGINNRSATSKTAVVVTH